MISYPDAHRYRLSVNYDSLPVNKSQCPFHTYNRDGAIFDGNSGSSVNYEPNSFGGPTRDPAFRERPRSISGTVDRHNHRLDGDYYTQPGGNSVVLTKAIGATQEREFSDNLAPLVQADPKIKMICYFVAGVQQQDGRVFTQNQNKISADQYDQAWTPSPTN